MRIGINYGRERLELDMPENSIAAVQKHTIAPPLTDPVAAVTAALESPLDFPPLRRALTPDDHIAIVVDEQVPRVAELLVPILEHLVSALIEPSAVTLVCAPSSSTQAWVENLPDAFEEVRIEVHDPTDRRKLSYLATTKHDRRLYLNRTVVDADPLIVLSRRGYDPLLGYSGAEGAIYPALGDETTRQEMCGRLSMAVPADVIWPVRKEAEEVAWLLGAPFLVQVIEGAGDEIANVIGGTLGSSSAGQTILNHRWRWSVAEPVATVIAGISGDPAATDFADLARALACAARVVRDGGRIVLLTQAVPQLGAGADMLRQADDPAKALALLRQHTPLDMAAAFLWASAVQKAQVMLLSGLGAETAEELFTTPLDRADQVQRLLTGGGPCVFLPDAHKALAVITV